MQSAGRCRTVGAAFLLAGGALGELAFRTPHLLAKSSLRLHLPSRIALGEPREVAARSAGKSLSAKDRPPLSESSPAPSQQYAWDNSASAFRRPAATAAARPESQGSRRRPWPRCASSSPGPPPSPSRGTSRYNNMIYKANIISGKTRRCGAKKAGVCSGLPGTDCVPWQWNAIWELAA